MRVRNYDTSGTYPQLRGSGVEVERVNAALRNAILADQRGYARFARKYESSRRRGVYSTSVERELVSASTVVVSALIPLTALAPAASDGKTWLAVTVRGRTAQQVELAELFADPVRGIQVLGKAWKARMRGTQRRCLDIYRSHYAASARNYRHFALTPAGLAVGFGETGACGRLHATVPYAVLRPSLSRLGATLVAGVRAPRYRS